MSFKQDGYYYDTQIKRYILQFMAIFTGLQVQVGKWEDKDERLISCPIFYAHVDRVVAGILTDHTQNTPIRLPVMSAYMSGLALAPSRMHGTGVEGRQSYVPVGGLIPDDITVVSQRQPSPYDITIDLNVYASNTDQHFQMLEQILPLFEPQLNIQTSDGLFDRTRISTVHLENVTLNTNFPVGTDRRIIQSTLSFKMPVWLAIPAEVRTNYIAQIMLRVGAVGSDVPATEIASEFDAQGLPYEVISDINNSSIT